VTLHPPLGNRPLIIGPRLWLAVLAAATRLRPTLAAATRLLPAALALALIGQAQPAAAANNAVVAEQTSSVPASAGPGALVPVTVRVVNTGDTTWRAATAHRLGAAPTNQVAWSGAPCGGYMNNLQDGRVFLCRDVAPGQSYDFQFTIKLPAAGAAVFAVRMVRDGVEWFGETQAWSIAVVSGCPTAPLATPADRWKLEVFGNKALSGSPVEQRYDAVGASGFTFDWGTGRASSCTGVDNFGVRFSRTMTVAVTGEYRFTTTTDDGVRLSVDGQLVIDRWIDQAPTSASATKFLSAGAHDVRVDYYENGGGAYAAIRWEPIDVASGGLFGINLDPANPKGNPSSSEVRAIGARWTRVEYKSHLGTAFYDARIAALRSAGLKVLLIVDYASVPGKPSGTGTDAQWSAYLASFGSGLRTLASHYGNGVDAWQIWNEPDLPPQPGYDVYMPARHFGIMLRDSVSTLRQFSTRPIVTAGLASGDPGYLAQARDAAAGLTVDAVAVHPYGQRAPDNWPNASWGFGNMSALFDRYLVFGKPLWVSEIGVNTTDQAFEATYLKNVYDLARDRYAGRVVVVFWFCWSDGMVPPFGILDANQNPKPAYYQYRAIAPPY
jgi:hypothetical protein